MVERVAEATGGKPADARLCELGRLTDAGTTELLASQLAEVGAAMSRAHTMFASWAYRPADHYVVRGCPRRGRARREAHRRSGGRAIIALALPGREAAVRAA
jgi:hypothetical protein